MRKGHRKGVRSRAPCPRLLFQACSWPSWRSVGPSRRSTRPACPWARAPWPPATRTSSSAWRCSSRPWRCGMPSPTRSMQTRGWMRKVGASGRTPPPAGDGLGGPAPGSPCHPVSDRRRRLRRLGLACGKGATQVEARLPSAPNTGLQGVLAAEPTCLLQPAWSLESPAGRSGQTPQNKQAPRGSSHQTQVSILSYSSLRSKVPRLFKLLTSK